MNRIVCWLLGHRWIEDWITPSGWLVRISISDHCDRCGSVRRVEVPFLKALLGEDAK